MLFFQLRKPLCHKMKVPITPPFFFTWLNFRCFPYYLIRKVFGPEVLLPLLYLFKVREWGALLTHGRHCRRIGLSLPYRMPDSCIIRCNNKSDKESVRALHRIPLSPIVSEEEEKSGSILHSLTVYACFVGEWNPEMTSQGKLDPCFCIVGQKPAQLPCFERVQQLEEKSRAKNFTPC